MIPSILNLKIKKKNEKEFKIWLPLFLLWIIVVPLLLLLAPLAVILALIMLPFNKVRFVIFSYSTVFVLIWNMSGLKIDICSRNNIVFLNLI